MVAEDTLPAAGWSLSVVCSLGCEEIEHNPVGSIY